MKFFSDKNFHINKNNVQFQKLKKPYQENFKNQIFYQKFPSNLAPITNNKTIFGTNTPTENKYTSQQKSYDPFPFILTQNIAANTTQNGSNNSICLVNFGLLSLIGEAKFNTVSNNQLQEVQKLHVASLKHVLLSCFAGKTGLLYGFKKNDRTRRKFKK